ncbi:MAG TPA: TPM domain-containing protein [Thermomicrobiales bacterium]|nr:TPM domain-containing protein [Thermomicrobiales bacterium]
MLNPASAQRLLILLVASTIAVTVMFPTVHQASAQDESPPIPYRAPDDPWLVRDDARLFSEDEMKRFQFDLRRLQGLGVDVAVYTRRADASREDSEQFADALRESWAVESAPGANDGMVLLLTVSGSRPRASTFVMSSGDNFFPLGQVDQADFDRIYEEEVAPHFRENRFDVALAYALRRMLYAADYTPPDPPPVSGIHALAHDAARIGGAVLVQAALLGLAIVPALMERRLTIHPSRKTVRIYAMVFGGASILLALVSVVGRSGLGILLAILVLALVTSVTALFLTPAGTSASGARRVAVVPSERRQVGRSLARISHRKDRHVPQT